MVIDIELGYRNQDYPSVVEEYSPGVRKEYFPEVLDLMEVLL